MPYFGDIYIPWITDKDTSISREVIEKNFVDEPPQVFEQVPSLESGTYSAILNETVHDRSETFEEQIDSIRSMPSRHPCEFPHLNSSGGISHLVVDSSTASITPSLEVRESELEVRNMDSSDYRAAFDVSPHNSTEFEPTEEHSLLAIPSVVDSVYDSDGNLINPEYTLESEGGDLDLYFYSSNTHISFDRSKIPLGGNYGVNYGESYGGNHIGFDEMISPVRVLSVDGNYGSDYGESYTGTFSRVYSDSKSFENVTIENGLIQSYPDGDKSHMYLYRSSSDEWDRLGYVNETNDVGYSETVGNYLTTLSFVDGYSLSLRKGYTACKFEAVWGNEFTFESQYTLETGSEEGYYYTVDNSQGDEIVLVLDSLDGSFGQSNNIITVSGLDESKEYAIYVGFVPKNISTPEYADAVLNSEYQKRTMVIK